MVHHPHRHGRVLRLILAGALVVLVAAALSVLPVQAWLIGVGERLRSFGAVGIALFVAIYVVGAMALVPASALSLASGLLYGPLGIVASWAAMMVAACISFALARHLVRAPVRRALDERRRLRAVADVVDEEGWRMVLLVRVSGIVPFGLQNYVLGLTRIPFGPYILASSVGILPSILVYAGAGAFGGALSDGEHQPLPVALLALAVLAGLVLAVTTARKVRARLAGR